MAYLKNLDSFLTPLRKHKKCFETWASCSLRMGGSSCVEQVPCFIHGMRTCPVDFWSWQRAITEGVSSFVWQLASS